MHHVKAGKLAEETSAQQQSSSVGNELYSFRYFNSENYKLQSPKRKRMYHYIKRNRISRGCGTVGQV
jgi:hypothetical protein